MSSGQKRASSYGNNDQDRRTRKRPNPEAKHINSRETQRAMNNAEDEASSSLPLSLFEDFLDLPDEAEGEVSHTTPELTSDMLRGTSSVCYPSASYNPRAEDPAHPPASQVDPRLLGNLSNASSTAYDNAPSSFRAARGRADPKDSEITNNRQAENFHVTTEESFFVPDTDPSRMSANPIDTTSSVDPSTTSTGTDNWARYRESYKAAVRASSNMTQSLQKLNQEHRSAMDRARKTAARRNDRIAELERETAALKIQLGKTVTNTTVTSKWKEKYEQSQAALEMMTKDNQDLEARCTTLKQDLDAAAVKVSDAERKASGDLQHWDSMTEQLEKAWTKVAELEKSNLCGSEQLTGLQKILTRINELIIERLKGISTLTRIVEEHNDDNLRRKLEDRVKTLVEIWREFEEEYHKAIGA